jgi:hypothetical protein
VRLRIIFFQTSKQYHLTKTVDFGIFTNIFLTTTH